MAKNMSKSFEKSNWNEWKIWNVKSGKTKNEQKENELKTINFFIDSIEVV